MKHVATCILRVGISSDRSIQRGVPRRFGWSTKSSLTLVCTTLVILTSAGLAAANDLLDQWIDTALEQNQEVIAARQAWQAAKQRAPQARSFDDPMVGVNFMRMDNTRFDDYEMTEVMVSQRLPWFGKRGARIDTAERTAEAAGFRLLETRRDVQARVQSAYWNLWVAQRAVEINRENLELLTQFEEIARARYEAGQGMQADVLRAQVGRDRLETDLLTLERELEVAQARINRLLSEPVQMPRRVPSPEDPPAIEHSLDDLYQKGRAYCCVLLSFLLEVEAREAALRRARLEYAPDFEVRVAARQQDGRSGFQEYDTGVAINIPWLWRGKYNARIREAQAELDRALAMFQDEVDMTSLEITEYYIAADAGYRTVRLFEEVILPRTQEFLDSTRAAYESGKVTLLELINAQRAWEDANLAYERARAQHGADRAKLDEITLPWTEDEIATGLVTEDMVIEEDLTNER